MIASELSIAVANAWERMALALGEARQRVEYDLITLLRRLDEDGADPEAVLSALRELLRPFPAAQVILAEWIRVVAPHQQKGTAPAAMYKIRNRYTVVPVYYGTDRAQLPTTGGSVAYSGDRGELTLGMAEVSIPDDHRMGAVERPRWWRLEFREDPQRHVVVHDVSVLARNEFVARTLSALERSAKKEIVLFVHGYNVGFEDAIVRTAQIAYDLHFEGIATAYSWPSEASVAKYTVDETNVGWSRPRFLKFLTMLREELGAETVHIIAHSMGSRLVAETLALLSPAGDRAARIRELVFAAPDIDAATFKDLAPGFARSAKRVTLYASSEDRALRASKLVHKHPRAGESGLSLVVVRSVDTIDATTVDTSLMGHSYYGDNRSVLADMFDLLRRGTPPGERFGLVAKERYGSPYWLFSP